MKEPTDELREWVDEVDGELDVGDHVNVPEDGDWLLHVEDDNLTMTVTHFTEEDGAGVLYGDLYEKKEDGRDFDLMIQEELMVQEIPKLGNCLRFRPQPDAVEVAIGRTDDGVLRATVVGQ